MKPSVKKFGYELGTTLAEAERVLDDYGVGHWKLSLLAWNPENHNESLILVSPGIDNEEALSAFQDALLNGEDVT